MPAAARRAIRRAPRPEAHGDIAVLAVTSADRLNAGWTAAQRASRHGHASACSHIETLLDAVSRAANLLTVTDDHPATLGWLGAVQGHKTVSLGVEHFGQTGTIADLYAHFGIDTLAIIEAAEALARTSDGDEQRHTLYLDERHEVRRHRVSSSR